MSARADSTAPVSSLAWSLVVLFAGLGGALAVGFFTAILPLLLVLAVLGAAVATLLRPDLGLALLIFVTYLNTAEYLINTYSFPSLVKFTAVALIGAMSLRWACFGATPGGDRTSLMVLGLVWFSAAASLFDVDTLAIGYEALNRVTRDMLFALLMLMIVINSERLRLIAWTLLLAGATAATAAVHQYLRGSFEYDYFGLARTQVHQIVGEIDFYRAGGPVEEPNYFAQILLIAMPFAADRTLYEPRRWLRPIAAFALAMCLLAIIFTFSRGGFVALVAMTLAFALRWAREPRAFAVLALVGVLTGFAVPTEYWDRLRAVGLAPGETKTTVEDPAIQGRRTEMIVAWHMFLDNPLFGVGEGSYPDNFQSYVQKLRLPARHENREAHSLYLELAAERGAVGILSVGVLGAVTVARIALARRRLRASGAHDAERIASAVAISLLGFGVSAIFLHGAYARYFWIILGLALALERVTMVAQIRHEGQGGLHARKV